MITLFLEYYSVDSVQREKERILLEKLYKESDKKLDTLVEG
jgi:hypothetical protein